MRKLYVFLGITVIAAVLTGGLVLFRINDVRPVLNEDSATVESVETEQIEVQSGWIEEDGEWYYIDEYTGEKQAGWIEVEGEQYYLDPITYIRQEGLLKISEQEWYYLDDEGKKLKNCVRDNYVIDENGFVERILLTEQEREVRKQEIQPTIDEILKRYGTISSGIALIENGEVTNTWEYGYAVKDSVEMSPDTKIRIASITKIILAMNAFKLAENGVVDIDESIGTYWGFPIKNPEYPEEPVTLRSIFSHTSSIADVEGYKNIGSRLEKNNVFRSVKPSDASGWSYCNYAFAVAGTTIEMAADKTIYEISEENFFDPMGIDASFAGGRLENSDLLANLYYAGGSLARSKETMAGFMGHDTPGEDGSFMPGGLCISAQDLAKMICILVNDGVYQGQRYLSEESVNIMETEYCSADLHGAEVIQCLPLKYRTDIYGEDRLYFHTGSAYGAYTLFSYNPDTKNGVIVLTIGASGTCDEYGIYAVCGEISEVLYQETKKLMFGNEKIKEEI